MSFYSKRLKTNNKTFGTIKRNNNENIQSIDWRDIDNIGDININNKSKMRKLSTTKSIQNKVNRPALANIPSTNIINSYQSTGISTYIPEPLAGIITNNYPFQTESNLELKINSIEDINTKNYDSLSTDLPIEIIYSNEGSKDLSSSANVTDKYEFIESSSEDKPFEKEQREESHKIVYKRRMPLIKKINYTLSEDVESDILENINKNEDKAPKGMVFLSFDKISKATTDEIKYIANVKRKKE